jgi:hypothetical protein
MVVIMPETGRFAFQAGKNESAEPNLGKFATEGSLSD